MDVPRSKGVEWLRSERGWLWLENIEGFTLKVKAAVGCTALYRASALSFTQHKMPRSDFVNVAMKNAEWTTQSSHYTVCHFSFWVEIFTFREKIYETIQPVQQARR